MLYYGSLGVTAHRRGPTRPMQNNSADSRPRSSGQIHALKWAREILAQFLPGKRFFHDLQLTWYIFGQLVK